MYDNSNYNIHVSIEILSLVLLCLVFIFQISLIRFKLELGFQVDLVEPVSHFLEAARENLTGCMDAEQDTHKAANFYCTPLQVG